MHNTTPTDQPPSADELRREYGIAKVLRYGMRAGLNNRQLRALEYILENLRPDGSAEIPIAELMEALGAHEITLIRDMHTIERAGILSSHRETANSIKIYQLSDSLAGTGILGYALRAAWPDLWKTPSQLYIPLAAHPQIAPENASQLPIRLAPPPRTPNKDLFKSSSHTHKSLTPARVADPSDPVCVSLFEKKLTDEGIAPLLIARWERELPDEYRHDLLAALRYVPQTVRDRAGYIATMVRDRFLPKGYLAEKARAAQRIERPTPTPPENSQVPPVSGATLSDADFYASQNNFFKAYFRNRAAAIYGAADDRLDAQIIRLVHEYRTRRNISPGTLPNERGATL